MAINSNPIANQKLKCQQTILCSFYLIECFLPLTRIVTYYCPFFVWLPRSPSVFQHHVLYWKCLADSNFISSYVFGQKNRSVILAAVNKNRISLTSHILPPLLDGWWPALPSVALFCRGEDRGHQLAGSSLFSPCDNFFFFKLQTPLTRYLHPCLIYAIRGSIAVCLIHSFILLSLCPPPPPFFIFFLKVIYIYRFLPEPTGLFPSRFDHSDMLTHLAILYQASLLWGSKIVIKQV